MALINFDETRCSNCGACVKVCTKGVLVTGEKTPELVKPQACTTCGHCVIACNQDAISHDQVEPGIKKTGEGKLTSQQVAAFLKSKRSVRKYLDKPIEKETLEEIFDVVRYAPTAKNRQDRGLIVVTDREVIRKMDRAVCQSFGKLVKILNWPVRKLMALSMPAFVRQLEMNLPSLRALVERSDAGEMPIFHDAPCVIFTIGAKGNQMAKDNAVIAQQYLTLQAHSMGIGSCIIGYAAARIKAVKPFVQIPSGHKIITATTLGYTDVSYDKLPPRKRMKINWV